MALLRAAACALACAACSIAALMAQAQQPSEAAVKAAFLYKFAAYIEWPASARPDAPFVIATLSADDVAAELSALLPGRTVGGRPAAARKVTNGESLQDVSILFVGRRAADPKAAIEAARRQGVLTVTEIGLEHGAAINFVVADERVSFEVSLEAAERSGHRISSRMLSVARRVVPKGAT